MSGNPLAHHLNQTEVEDNRHMELTKEDFEKLLREAERAHGEYEQKLGKRDDNWPSWYAEFIVQKLRDREKQKKIVPRSA